MKSHGKSIVYLLNLFLLKVAEGMSSDPIMWELIDKLDDMAQPVQLVLQMAT
jgi:hypothetical protein